MKEKKLTCHVKHSPPSHPFLRSRIPINGTAFYFFQSTERVSPKWELKDAPLQVIGREKAA